MEIIARIKRKLQPLKTKLGQLDREKRTALMMLLFSFIALSTATYAWITASLNASTGEASMTTRIYGNFSVAQGKYETPGSVPPGAFQKTVSFAPHAQYTEKEISSNGQLFYTWDNTTKDPVTNKPLAFTALDTTVATLDANSEKDYIAQDFTFMASENTRIYLTNDSSITNVGTNVKIAPAARVAFYEWDPVGDKYDFKYVWAPNTAQITSGNKSGSVKYISDTAGTETTYTGYTNNALPSVGGIIYTDEEATYAPAVTTITATEPTLKTIQVRIWLEGTDAAAVNANLVDNKGQWKVDLRFSTGIQIKPSAYSETLDGVKIKPDTLGLLPVTYDASGNAIIADIYNSSTPWFSYASKQWANAVSVSNANKSSKYLNGDGSYKAGTTVLATDIMGYFVYIPRYSYSMRCTSAGMTTCYGTSSGTTAASSAATPGTMDIKFIGTGTKETGSAKYQPLSSPGTSYYTPSAFTFGTQELAGIWVGKFETTGTIAAPTIKPGVTAVYNQNISDKFQAALKFGEGTINTTTGAVTFAGVSSIYGTGGTGNTSANSHMAKLNEWQAVANFTQSKYGVGTSQSGYANHNNAYLTGCGDTGSVAIAGCSAWTTAGGKLASTTANLYGIYDMNGGGRELVLTNYKRYVGVHEFWSDWCYSVDGHNYYYSGFNGSLAYFTHDVYDSDCPSDPEVWTENAPTTLAGSYIAQPSTSYFEDYTTYNEKDNGALTSTWWSSTFVSPRKDAGIATWLFKGGGQVGRGIIFDAGLGSTTAGDTTGVLQASFRTILIANS